MKSREFYFEFCRLINCINVKYDDFAKKVGIVSSNLFWLLYALSDGKRHTQLELSEYCGLPKTTTNTIIKNLEKEGLIVLEQGIDKREKVIVFTVKGQKLADDVLQDLFAREDQLFNQNKEVLTKLIDELVVFNNLLDDLNK